MRLLITLFLVGTLAGIVHAADPITVDAPVVKTDLNVLFIGNSMTWWNHMPRLVADLAAAMDPPVRVFPIMAVSPGMTLDGHLKEGSLARRAIAGDIATQRAYLTKEMQWYQQEAVAHGKDAAIAQNAARIAELLRVTDGKPKWDVVVIEPWGSDTADAKILSKKIRQLQDMISVSSPGARVIIYMVEQEKLGGNTDEVIRRRMSVYKELAATNNVQVAPAALACLLINMERPKKMVGGVHPDQLGSYAIACSVFTTLFDRSPVGLPVARVESHQYLWGKYSDGKPIDGIDFPAQPASFDASKKGSISVKVLNDDERTLIQANAWKAWQEWKTLSSAPAPTESSQPPKQKE
ncbi:MAG: hypothetical protein WCJ56_10430 [bacterium]